MFNYSNEYTILVVEHWSSWVVLATGFSRSSKQLPLQTLDRIFYSTPISSTSSRVWIARNSRWNNTIFSLLEDLLLWSSLLTGCLISPWIYKNLDWDILELLLVWVDKENLIEFPFDCYTLLIHILYLLLFIKSHISLLSHSFSYVHWFSN